MTEFTKQEIKQYKKFIDGLVNITEPVQAKRFERGLWHPEPPPEQVKYNELLDSLSDEQRNLISEIITESASGAVHDVLVYLTDNEYELTCDGIKLAEEPFDNPMYYDYVC